MQILLPLGMCLSFSKRLLSPSWVLFREQKVPTLDKFIVYSPPKQRGRELGEVLRVGLEPKCVGVADSLGAAPPPQGPYLSLNVKMPKFVTPLVPLGFSQCPYAKINT